MSGQHSQEFFELIKAIGETKSKQEEDKIVIKEITKLKTLLAQKNIKSNIMKEYVVRALYCEMLGHSADFAYINAVNLTSSTNPLHKRVGYLGVCLSIPTNNELMLLLIAVIQKDLKSSNFLEVSAALSAASKIITTETLPALLDLILALKNHN